MAQETVTIKNEEGMHARPAGVFVTTANQFKSVIELTARGLKKNGKSIMGIMSMGLQFNDQVLIMAQGEDEGPALEALVKLVNNKFQI